MNLSAEYEKEELKRRGVYINCEVCNKTLTKENCTLITNTCDNCLADQAADNRVIEQGY